LKPWWERFGLSGVGAALLMIRVASAWPNTGWPEVIGLVLCLCVHYGKSFVEVNRSPDFDSSVMEAAISQLQSDVENLEGKMSGIELANGITTTPNGQG